MLKKVLFIVLLGLSGWVNAATCPSYADWIRTEIGADKQWGLKDSDKVKSEHWQVAQPFFNYSTDTLPSNMTVLVLLSEGGNEVRCLYSLDQGGPLIAVTSKFVDFTNASHAFTNSIYEADVGMGPAAYFNNPSSSSSNDSGYQPFENRGKVLEKACQTTVDALETCSFDWK